MRERPQQIRAERRMTQPERTTDGVQWRGPGCVKGMFENERARRAYVKAGFEPLAEQRSDDWPRELGCPGTEMLLQPL